MKETHTLAECLLAPKIENRIGKDRSKPVENFESTKFESVCQAGLLLSASTATGRNTRPTV